MANDPAAKPDKSDPAPSVPFPRDEGRRPPPRAARPLRDGDRVVSGKLAGIIVGDPGDGAYARVAWDDGTSCLAPILSLAARQQNRDDDRD